MTLMPRFGLSNAFFMSCTVISSGAGWMPQIGRCNSVTGFYTNSITADSHFLRTIRL